LQRAGLRQKRYVYHSPFAIRHALCKRDLFDIKYAAIKEKLMQRTWFISSIIFLEGIKPLYLSGSNE